MRLLLPDGYKISPHTHPKVEHVTVIAGIFNLGMGEKFDQSAAREMPAGTFGSWPAGKSPESVHLTRPTRSSDESRDQTTCRTSQVLVPREFESE